MAFMPTRQNTVDMIPELPDIDFFSIPVDDFYDDYVNELEMRNSRKMSGPLPSLSGNPGFQVPGTLSSSTPLMQPQMQQESLLQPQNGNFLPNSLLTGQLGASMQQTQQQQLRQQQPQFQQMPDFNANLLGMPSIPGSGGNLAAMSAQPGLFQTGSPNQPESGGSDISFEHDDQFSLDHNTGSSNGRRTNSKLHARDTKTKRNPKQQMQNKQAQQRYRERRKQKFVEMEQALDQLASQSKDMNSLQTQHHLLQGKTAQLEQILRQKELEIERLQQQLESKKSSGSSESSGDVCDNLNLGEDNTEACASQKKKRSEAELQQYQHDWKQHVLRLKEYFDNQGLENADPLGEGVDPAVMQQVAKMVGQSCSTCSKAMRAEGIKVMELMSRDIGSLTHITCSVAREKWGRILQCLRLGPSQREAVMAARKEHLNKLRAVCQERQDLNFQAMTLMLPRQPDCPDRKSEAKSTLEGKLDCMSLNGYGSTARDNVDLNSVLDKIKGNLRKEQRIVMEMNFAVMNRILSPLQCAIFFMEAFPAHCDCLALANILAFQLHREDSFDRTGSGNHSSSNLQNGRQNSGSDSRSLQNGHNNSGSHNSGNIDMAASNGGSNAQNVAAQMDQAVQNVSRSNSVSA